MAECVTSYRATLGEGPLWVASRNALYWIDIREDTLLRYEPATGRTGLMKLPARPTALVEHAAGHLVVSFKKGLGAVDFDLQRAWTLPIEGVDFAREDFNDAACDASGRLWIGTRDPDPAPRARVGKLYRVGPGLRARCMDEGFVISNGRAWSPDGATFYHTDSMPGRIDAYDFDAASGSLSNRRVFIDYTGRGFRPDGCTVDAEGCLWVAEVEGSRVARYSPRGELLQRVELPVRKPSSVMFGGDDLRTLFITTVSAGLTSEEASAQPLAGGLFAHRSDVPGLPEHPFRSSP
ncbi:SMP-30/gluconolactonase/LRE family protein [Ramlibacter sp.]|uniref:SMP-30/gluconolactonase/LRE family protein n=1 Tax=Ramlibacter sp. TaxID=1917967 RepID=UPI002D8020B8|nr:SMP-30/gluconolactonase/LRE family protein [Ramlibacter sp.]